MSRTQVRKVKDAWQKCTPEEQAALREWMDNADAPDPATVSEPQKQNRFAQIEANLEILKKSPEFRRGYRAGWTDAIDEWWKHGQELNDRYYTLGTAISYVYGVASAGFGEIIGAQLRELGGKIADAATQLELEVERSEEQLGENFGLDLTEAIQVKDALKAMYSGQDEGEQLREIAAKSNPIFFENVVIKRPQFKPGAKTKKAIEWLCEKVADIYNTEPSFTREDAHQKLLNDLFTQHEAGLLMGIEKDAWKQFDRWGGNSFDNLWKNVDRRVAKKRIKLRT